MILFLDDQRKPSDVFEYTGWEEYREDVLIVRTYEQFVENVDKYIHLIQGLMLDHDLLPEHYVPSEYWDDFNKSKDYQNIKIYHNTGADCARYFLQKWIEVYGEVTLIDFNVYVHSQNPVGVESICNVFESYKRLYGSEINVNSYYA